MLEGKTFAEKAEALELLKKEERKLRDFIIKLEVYLQYKCNGQCAIVKDRVKSWRTYSYEDDYGSLKYDQEPCLVDKCKVCGQELLIKELD